MLKIKNQKMLRSALMMSFMTIGLLGIAANQAAAQSRIFNFFIQNIDSAPVTVTLDASWAGTCYEGNPSSGEIFENVPPQGKVKIVLARVQGNGCDGKAGSFQLTFSPKVGVKEKALFNFDNSGSLWVVPTANQYPGNLGPKGGPSDQSYTYTTFARPKVTAGKPQGSWEFLCQGVCNEEYSNQITNQTTKDTTISEETKTAVSVALEAGVEFEGVGSAKTTVTASLEKSVGRSMSTGVLNSSTTTRTKRVIYTPEQMNTLNIFAVWQWVAKTKLSNSQMILVKSDKITCTPDGNEPTYLPGSKEDVGACYGKTSASNDKPQDANPKPNPVETPKPIINPPSTLPTARINVALASNGGVASASSTIWKNVPNYPSFPEASAINGDRTGRKWGSGGGWNDETSGSFPDWLQVDFSGQKNIDEINIVTLQDGFETAGEPTAETKFTKNGIKDFVVQYWNGRDWVTVQGGSITGNDLVIITFKFTPVSTTKIRVTVTAALQDYSRIVQFEAWGNK